MRWSGALNPVGCALSVKETPPDADDAGIVRLRSYDIALIGIVLLACGIVALVTAPGPGLALPAAAALWSSALMSFAVARRPGRR
jgi:hypothetical protein